MSTINSYKSFSAEIGELATTIDHATSGKAVEKATNALFDRLRTTVPVTKEQGLACTAKLNAIKSRIEAANDDIEARCWKKMGLFKRFFSTIMWVALSITKEGYRASQPLNTQKLLDRINDAEGRFKITAAQIKKSAPKSLPAPAALQVAGKTIVVQFQAAAPAVPNPKDNCLRNIELIQAKLKEFPEKHLDNIQKVQKRYLELLVKDQQAIIDSLDRIKSEGLKITKAPQEMQELIAAHLAKIKDRLEELEAAKNQLQELDPVSSQYIIQSEGFNKAWQDVHATLTAQFEADNRDFTDDRNIRMLPLQDRATSLLNNCAVLNKIFFGLNQNNFAKRLQQLKLFQAQLEHL